MMQTKRSVRPFAVGLIAGTSLSALAVASFFGFHVYRASPLWIMKENGRSLSANETERALRSGKLLHSASEVAGLTWCSAFTAAAVGATEGFLAHHTDAASPDTLAEAQRYFEEAVSRARAYSEHSSVSLYFETSQEYALFLADSGQPERARTLVSDLLAQRSRLRADEQWRAENLLKIQKILDTKNKNRT